MSGSGAALDIRDLRVRYVGRSTDALTDISLALGQGRLAGVTGRTGAGKSTIALAAAGFLPRVVRATVQGSVTIAGIDALRAPVADLVDKVGVVFSTPAHQLSASKLTVREELAFGLENLAVARADMDGRIDDVLERLDITQLAGRDPLSLSGGEQQRVAIASILVMGPRVLVLDEPVAQLDPAGAALIGAMLTSLAVDGATVLVAEHAPTILGCADQVTVLEGGRIVVTDVPGAALSAAYLAPLGYQPPTLVRLAEIAQVPAAAAFDEQAVAVALAARTITPGHPGDGSIVAPGPPAPEELPPASRDTPSVAVLDLVHRYPGAMTAAVDGVTLVIPAGQTLALVGQNGSGKSTLVKHLNGLLRPSGGSVRLRDQDIRGTDVSGLARDVGFVFQDPDDQLFERSVAREVAFGPRQMGIPGSEIADRVSMALALVGLDGERDANPYDLGPSLRKLVALASVLASAPGVVVLDEPTGGQDPPGVARIGGIIRALAAAGRTVVAITHDMEFAASTFERVVVLGQGRIIADGPGTEVLSAAAARMLSSTGLTPPVTARIAGRLGLPTAPADVQGLLDALAGRQSP